MWWVVLALFIAGCVAVFGDSNTITTHDNLDPKVAGQVTPVQDEDDPDEDEDHPSPGAHTPHKK